MDEIIAGWLDYFRAELLKKTLSLDLFRKIFCNRAYRLFTFFLISIVFSLFASILLPFWVLAIGPVIYGVPHLFSSMRYFHYTVSPQEVVGDPQLKRRLFVVLLCIMIALSTYGLGVSFSWIHLDPAILSEWKGSSGAEMLALLITVGAAVATYRNSISKGFLGVLVLLPLLGALILAPLPTIGILVLLHNYVGFIYWRLAAKNSAEKKAAVGALAIVLVLTALIFAGGLDWVCGLIRPDDKLAFAHLNYSDLGKMIFPWSTDSKTWIHATLVYAFGQSVHYFVWLKAIPDQQHSHFIPTSFRQSLRLLKLDFGRIGLTIALCLSFFGLLSWAFLSFYQARVAYFALASYHGYLEIAGLALAFPRLQQCRDLPRVNPVNPFL